MKKAGAYRVLGLYGGGDGAWQAATVASDGVVLEDVQPFRELDRLEQVADQAANVGAIAVETTVDAEAPDLAGLRRATSLPILHSFRDNDRGMGGHGRPLEPFYLHALARHLQMLGPVLFVDLGRVARLCWADPAIADPTQAVLAFEAGPALGGLERLLNQRGISAPKGGQVVDGALELFLDDPFFRRMPPKWVQPDSFALMLDLVMELVDADAYATLCGMAATAVMLGLEHLPQSPATVVLTGPGHSHPRLVPMLRAALDVPVRDLADMGGHPDSLQAQAIAYLGARVLAGLPTTAPNTTGAPVPVGGAEILR